MNKIKKGLYFKPIGELTQKEFELLFNIPVDINDKNFRKTLEPFAEHSIFDIDLEKFNPSELDFSAAYMLGSITALKANIPTTHLLAVFGEPGCGKSHLIHLIYWLKQLNLDEIKEEDRIKLGFEPKQYEADAKIRGFKELADSITIIQKKTTRPPRDEVKYKPEIKEGLPLGEVQKCDWTYTMTGNLYGFSKSEIDEALKNGHAIVIVNDPKLEIMRELKKAYPSELVPLTIIRTANLEEWEDLMKKDNRTPEEIEKRKNFFGKSIDMYDHIQIPEVILNQPIMEVSSKDLLVQLQGVINRRDRLAPIAIEIDDSGVR